MPETSNFITIEPKSSILKKYISYFYFDHSQGESSNKYIYYPNHKVALTIYKDSKVQSSASRSISKPSKSPCLEYVYPGLRTHSMFVQIFPPYKRIGIVFEPLGINHFLTKSLIEVLQNKEGIRFNELAERMNPTTEKVFSTKTIDHKTNLLEGFFLAEFQEFNVPLLQKALDYIFKSKTNLSVNALCEAVDANRKTLLRLFHKHLNCTIKEYIDIVQFRNAMNMYQKEKGKSTLTKVAYDNGYYDQSEFIKHFKKVTGYNPKRVLSNLESLGDNKTFWTKID